MYLAPNNIYQAQKLPLNFNLTYISKSSRASPNPTSLRFGVLNGSSDSLKVPSDPELFPLDTEVQ